MNLDIQQRLTDVELEQLKQSYEINSLKEVVKDNAMATKELVEKSKELISEFKLIKINLFRINDTFENSIRITHIVTIAKLLLNTALVVAVILGGKFGIEEFKKFYQAENHGN